MLVGLVILLGIGLVFAARSSRDELAAPRIGEDHWHAIYEVFDCGTAMPNLVDNGVDPDGIHSHGDGLVHIHPFNSSATGADARFRVFFDATGLNVGESAITAADYPAIEASTGCGDGDAVIKVGRWNVDGPDGLQLETVYTADFGEIRFLHDREAFTIAKVGVDEDPPEPSAATLAQLDTSTGTTNFEANPIDLSELDLGTVPPTGDTTPDGTTPSTVPGSTVPGSTVPGDTVPTSEPVSDGSAPTTEPATE